ncbi:MAG: hypothetical protein AAF197_01670 [Pseudomonadota bacterium]
MLSNRLTLFTIYAGLSTVILSLVLMVVLPSEADLAEGFVTPILAFEFATKTSDLAFLSAGTEQALSDIERMHLGLLWDMAFPIAYSAFLALFAKSMSEGLSVPARYFWIGFILIVLFDYAENFIMFRLLNEAANASITLDNLAKLHIATWLKWMAIATAILGISITSIVTKRRSLSMLLGLIVFTVSLTCLLLSTPPVLAELMALLIAIYFLAALIESIVRYFRLRRAPG